MLGGEAEELTGVLPRVGGDAAQLPLLEQVLFVVERRDVGQVDACDGQGTGRSCSGFRVLHIGWRKDIRRYILYIITWRRTTYPLFSLS